MKSHAMKARAEAEAAQLQFNLQNTSNSGGKITTNVNKIFEKNLSTKNSPLIDTLSFVQQQQHHNHHQKDHQQQNYLNTDTLRVERSAMQITNNFPTTPSATTTSIRTDEHAFGSTIGKSGIGNSSGSSNNGGGDGSGGGGAGGIGGRLAPELFVQTTLISEHPNHPHPHQFNQNTLMPGSLGLAAHQAFNQSLTAASVLNQFPQAQALQFLNNLQNPAIIH